MLKSNLITHSLLIVTAAITITGCIPGLVWHLTLKNNPDNQSILALAVGFDHEGNNRIVGAEAEMYDSRLTYVPFAAKLNPKGTLEWHQTEGLLLPSSNESDSAYDQLSFAPESGFIWASGDVYHDRGTGFISRAYPGDGSESIGFDINESFAGVAQQQWYFLASDHSFFAVTTKKGDSEQSITVNYGTWGNGGYWKQELNYQNYHASLYSEGTLNLIYFDGAGSADSVIRRFNVDGEIPSIPFLQSQSALNILPQGAELLSSRFDKRGNLVSVFGVNASLNHSGFKAATPTSQLIMTKIDQQGNLLWHTNLEQAHPSPEHWQQWESAINNNTVTQALPRVKIDFMNQGKVLIGDNAVYFVARTLVNELNPDLFNNTLYPEYPSLSYWDIVVHKLTTDGAVEWSKRFSARKNENNSQATAHLTLNDADIGPKDNVVVAATSHYFDINHNSQTPMALMRTESNIIEFTASGEQRFIQTKANHDATSIDVSNSNRLLVATTPSNLELDNSFGNPNEQINWYEYSKEGVKSYVAEYLLK